MENIKMSIKTQLTDAGFTNYDHPVFINAVDAFAAENQLTIQIAKRGTSFLNKGIDFRCMISKEDSKRCNLFMPLQKYKPADVTAMRLWHLIYKYAETNGWVLPKNTPEKITCTRCGGTGRHSFNLQHGNMCYGCSGSGKMWAINGKKIK